MNVEADDHAPPMAVNTSVYISFDFPDLSFQRTLVSENCLDIIMKVVDFFTATTVLLSTCALAAQPLVTGE
jgi:hypothetical protein